MANDVNAWDLYGNTIKLICEDYLIHNTHRTFRAFAGFYLYHWTSGSIQFLKKMEIYDLDPYFWKIITCLKIKSTFVMYNNI